MKRFFALMMCLALCLSAGFARAGQGLPLQDCHRVVFSQKKTTRPNGAKVVRWQADTVQDAVDAELNAVAAAYAEELGAALPADGKLTVTIRPSRTGLTWMSFMVQARVTRSQKTQAVAFTTRTYDMTTGQHVRLTDVFPADSAAWEMMAQALRDGIAAYYPDEAAPAAEVDAATARAALEQAEFTLHGMSLVLHLDAARFYPAHPQLIEVPLYYPEIRPMMTEKARTETDNLTYYHTVALTIDDGPNGIVSTGILETLMAHGERATFFLVGERIRQQAFIVQQEHDEGHSVATHNWRHVYSGEASKAQLRTMAENVRKVHVETIGLAPGVCRAPGGHWKHLADAEFGWPLIQWTVEAQDWSGDFGPPPVNTSGNIVAGTEDGGIILMHDLKPNSIEAIDIILTRLQEKGYMFLTVEELFAKDGVTLAPNVAYWYCREGKTGE